ncbi:hypothetical protein ACWPOB_23535 [Rhodococcus sp. 2H158]|nr:hypothetical protein GQ85_24465 [Rhodococcus rhodochrous]
MFLEDPDAAAWPNLVHVLNYPKHHEAWFDIVMNELNMYEERNPITLAPEHRHPGPSADRDAPADRDQWGVSSNSSVTPDAPRNSPTRSGSSRSRGPRSGVPDRNIATVNVRRRPRLVGRHVPAIIAVDEHCAGP